MMHVACAWCPVTEETERMIRKGEPISHTICETCYGKLMVQLGVGPLGLSSGVGCLHTAR